jgi:carboxypeptidase Q
MLLIPCPSCPTWTRVSHVATADAKVPSAFGIPAFTVIKDFENYDVRTRHTNADFADAVNTEDLEQSATVLAAFIWQAATRDEQIPRKASK